MFDNPKLIPFIADLIQHGNALHYKDKFGTAVKVLIQPLAALDKLNADPANVAKMDEMGVTEALIIGTNELRIPIIVSCKNLKTYLLDPTVNSPGDYLKHEVHIKY